jgi:hypothetical protein
MPALVVLLTHFERKKGSPLTAQEVIDIRDKGACMMLRIEHAQALANSRGYDDIDPEDVWAERQRIRLEIAAADRSLPDQKEL